MTLAGTFDFTFILRREFERLPSYGLEHKEGTSVEHSWEDGLFTIQVS